MILIERIKNTKKLLRKQGIERTINDIHDNILHPDAEKRNDQYTKMLESPYQFFLGSSNLFYNDLSKFPLSFDTTCWTHGNLNVKSFQVFKDEKGKVFFDINNFHDGYKGSFLYDLIRMSVSIALYCDEFDLTKKEQKEVLYKFLKGYYRQLKKFKKGKADPTIIFTKKNTDGYVKKYIKKFEKNKEDYLVDLTYRNEQNERVFNTSHNLLSLTAEEKEKIGLNLEKYLSSINQGQWNIKDIVRKVDNESGLDRYYVLIGNENHEEMVLEVNEVCTPILAYYATSKEDWKQYENQGKRVATIEKTVRNEDDPFIGHLSMDDKQFYVRKYRQPKELKLSNFKELQESVKWMGKATAKIHSGNVSDENRTDILKEIDDFELFSKQIISIALHYKKQVLKDFAMFSKQAELDVKARELDQSFPLINEQTEPENGLEQQTETEEQFNTEPAKEDDPTDEENSNLPTSEEMEPFKHPEAEKEVDKNIVQSASEVSAADADELTEEIEVVSKNSGFETTETEQQEEVKTEDEINEQPVKSQDDEQVTESTNETEKAEGREPSQLNDETSQSEQEQNEKAE